MLPYFYVSSRCVTLPSFFVHVIASAHARCFHLSVAVIMTATVRTFRLSPYHCITVAFTPYLAFSLPFSHVSLQTTLPFTLTGLQFLRRRQSLISLRAPRRSALAVNSFWLLLLLRLLPLLTVYLGVCSILLTPPWTLQWLGYFRCCCCCF